LPAVTSATAANTGLVCNPGKRGLADLVYLAAAKDVRTETALDRRRRAAGQLIAIRARNAEAAGGATALILNFCNTNQAGVYLWSRWRRSRHRPPLSDCWISREFLECLG
jgi:hypothetical protein